MSDDYLSVAEACALFGYSRSGFYRRLRRAGVSITRGHGQQRFRLSDLEPLFVTRLSRGAVVDFGEYGRALVRAEEERRHA